MSQQKKNVEIEVGQTWEHLSQGLMEYSRFKIMSVGNNGIQAMYANGEVYDYTVNQILNNFELCSHESKPDQETYDNTNGSLYKVADERKWNSYVFDAMKRLDRAERKGQFISDIDKTIKVLEMYKEEQGHRFKPEL
jgi:hypothetical protein